MGFKSRVAEEPIYFEEKIVTERRRRWDRSIINIIIIIITVIVIFINIIFTLKITNITKVLYEENQAGSRPSGTRRRSSVRRVLQGDQNHRCKDLRLRMMTG